MLVIRHNRLLPPYHDYQALSLGALDDLALGKVSPSIAPLPQVLPWGEDIARQVIAADYMVCSSALRTQQTCAAVQALYGLDKKVRIDNRLDEILFTPSQLIVSAQENPLQAVRERLYTRLKERGAGVEAPLALEGRISDVFQEYRGENCIVFSHGFLMRLMQSVAVKKSNFSSALGAVSDVPPVDYLEAKWLDV